ncbi:MAG TPA: pseudouridine-5'-phosphate glycosidase [Trueperaceae bacterium]
MSLSVAPQIVDALSRAQPVVALESTVITHGLPHPRNLELAEELEAQIRERGAVPATVAVLKGKLVVGASLEDLEELAGSDAQKASLWNLGSLLAQGASAGTTVATTMHAAAAAGIEVFATGGIGGVHQRPFDESADLSALSRYPVLTVCAGPKSILDQAATLERLETLGVPVVGYRSRHLAGFHVRETELPLPATFDRPEGIAAAFRRHRELGLQGGMLVSNPVSEGLAQDELGSYRSEAEREASEAGVHGRDLTPFLLGRLAELSSGRTVEVNLRLLRENASLAARLAAALQLPRPLGALDE